MWENDWSSELAKDVLQLYKNICESSLDVEKHGSVLSKKLDWIISKLPLEKTVSLAWFSITFVGRIMCLHSVLREFSKYIQYCVFAELFEKEEKSTEHPKFVSL